MHKKQQRLESLEREGIARRRSRKDFHRLNHRKMKLKGKRELSTEKQRRCNCEMERERKQEERREGALKPHFPEDLLVRLALRKLPKLLTHTFPHWHAHMHGSLLPSHMRYTNTHWMERCGNIYLCVCVWTGFIVTFREWLKQTELWGGRETLAPLLSLLWWVGSCRGQTLRRRLWELCAGGTQEEAQERKRLEGFLLPTHKCTLDHMCVHMKVHSHTHTHTQQKGAFGRLPFSPLTRTHPLVITFQFLASSFLLQAQNMTWLWGCISAAYTQSASQYKTYGKQNQAAFQTFDGWR